MSSSKPQVATQSAQKTKRAKLIINPQAWHGSTFQEVADHIRDRMEAAGIQLEVVHTTETEHGTHQARDAAQNGVDLVIAAGGDGTIQEVAKGLIGSKATLGIIPCGTMNNIARSLYIPEDVDGACDLLISGQRKMIDVGLVNGKPFLEVVSIGFEAPLFALGEQTRHQGIAGALRATAGMLRLLWRLQPYGFTIELDGRKKLIRAQQISVCNTPRYGLGFEMAPDARMDDGLLDVVIIRQSRRWDLIRHYWSIMQNKRELDTRVQTRHAKRIRIHSKHLLPLTADGAEIGTLPANINVASRKLATIVGKQPETPPASPSPFVEILRTMAPQDTERSPREYSDAESARRMSQFASWYWAVTAALAGLVWLTHKLGLWQHLPAPKQLGGSRQQQQRHTLALRLIPIALAAIFWRLRMRLEALAFLLTGAMGSIVTPLWRWVGRRNPNVVEPDDATMHAVASMGVLGAGLWATRKPTARTFLFSGLLAGLGAWFSFLDRRSTASPSRQREGIVLGAGLGAVWLGGMVNLLAWLRHSLLHVAGTSEMADPATPPPTPVAPVLGTGDELAAPVAMQTNLERGDILLFGPDGTIGAQAIEFATRSHYHHIALYDGEGMVIEAMPEGVLRRPLGERRVTGVRPNIPAAHREAVADWAREHVGDKYDTRGLMLIAFDRVFPGLRLGGPPSHRFSCAVFVADAYMQEGYDLLPNERWQDLVPADFIALIDTPPKIVAQARHS